VLRFGPVALVAVTLLAWSGPAAAHSAHEKPAANPAQADVGDEPEPLPLGIGGPFALTDHNGHAVTDRDFRGRFLLLFFGYANCPGVCPIGLRTMTEAVDLLGAKQDAVTPLLITVDPERDTRATLGPALAKIHPRLIGLTGTPEQLAAARRAYQVGAKATGRDLAGGALFEHGTFIYLMGPDGQFLSLFPPVIDPAALAAAIARYMT
jgi:protein SCO1/2